MICWELILICCSRALESIHICCSPHMGQGPHALCWCCFVTKRASRCLYLDVHLDCNVARQQLCKKNTWRMMRMIARVEANETSFTDLQPGDTNTDYLSLVIEHNGQTGCCTMLRLWSLYGSTCIFFCPVLLKIGQLSYGQFITTQCLYCCIYKHQEPSTFVFAIGEIQTYFFGTPGSQQAVLASVCTWNLYICSDGRV